LKAARVEYRGRVQTAVVHGEELALVPDPGIEPIDLIAGEGWEALAAAASEYAPRSEVRFLAPVARPSKIFGIGINYRDHAAEQGKELPSRPIVFSILPSSVIGPGEPIQSHPEVTELDYEAELGVVIGKRCFRVPRSEAWGVIGGYTAVNDVSARDLQRDDGQWIRAKGLDGFTPMGPVLASPDEIQAEAVDIRCFVNGEPRQSSNTRNLALDIPALIEYCSGGMTLEPGDVIATGTPGGVGFAMTPPRFLQPGDVVTIEVEGIGELTNPVGGQSSSAK
jgi:2-keto-4-pentenoate hydratase/2-oxohepta-3-ene-1,7-dioic acid hydratase in catechol pathway